MSYPEFDTGFAAVAVIRNAAGLFLACTRKNAPNMWGFPGGKLDPGETPMDCIKRELFEETGLVTKMISFLSIGNDDSGHLVSAWAIELEDPNGNLLPESRIKVAWVDKSILSNPATTPYADYNSRQIRYYELLQTYPKYQ